MKKIKADLTKGMKKIKHDNKHKEGQGGRSERHEQDQQHETHEKAKVDFSKGMKHLKKIKADLPEGMKKTKRLNKHEEGHGGLSERHEKDQQHEKHEKAKMDFSKGMDKA